MRHFGYSTGAIAKDDVETALGCLRSTAATAVEFSALRFHELTRVLSDVFDSDTASFPYRSFHAPSRFAPSDEEHVLRCLQPLVDAGWPIIMHPDAICRPERWRPLGARLLIENMDQRKPIGRTAEELTMVFEELPQAGLCFDLGHVRQIDPSMIEAYRIIQRHGARIHQIHLSDVDNNSAHKRLNIPALNAFIKVVPLIDRDAPVILESTTDCSEVPEQLLMAKLLFAAASFQRPTKVPDHAVPWAVTSSIAVGHNHALAMHGKSKADFLELLQQVAPRIEGGSAGPWDYFREAFLTSAGISSELLEAQSSKLGERARVKNPHPRTFVRAIPH
jgi:hypothetical protein